MVTIHQEQINLMRFLNSVLAKAHQLQSQSTLIVLTSPSPTTIHRQSIPAIFKQFNNGRAQAHFLFIKGPIPRQALLLEVLLQNMRRIDIRTQQILILIPPKICGQTGS